MQEKSDFERLVDYIGANPEDYQETCTETPEDSGETNVGPDEKTIAERLSEAWNLSHRQESETGFDIC